MNTKKIVIIAVSAIAVLALSGTAYFTKDRWQTWLGISGDDTAEDDHHHPNENRVRITTQARAALKLSVKPISLSKSYARTLRIPAKVIERPSQGDRAITAPLTGVVTNVAVGPGEIIAPGQPLFTIRLVSENLQSHQSLLFETIRKIEILDRQKMEYEKLGPAVPKIKLVELEFEKKILQAKVDAIRFDLSTHGFDDTQIKDVAKGDFVKEVHIAAPAETPKRSKHSEKVSSEAKSTESKFEVEHIDVQLGDQVKIGQTLCVLGNHSTLYLEGAVYRKEMPLIQEAISQKSEAKIYLPGVPDDSASAAAAAPRLLYMGHEFDPSSQTVSVFGVLPNVPQIYHADGKSYRFWKYRPGQKLDLEIPVEEFHNVFVFPIEAVAHEGGEWYVFRENGSAFDRVAVTVLYRDSRNAVIANDKNLLKGDRLAWNHAATLLRMLQVQTSKNQGGGHHGHVH